MFSVPLSFCHGHGEQKNRACSSQPKHSHVPEKPCVLPRESGTWEISVKTPGVSFCTPGRLPSWWFWTSLFNTNILFPFSRCTGHGSVGAELFYFSRVCLLSSPHCLTSLLGRRFGVENCLPRGTRTIKTNTGQAHHLTHSHDTAGTVKCK